MKSLTNRFGVRLSIGDAVTAAHPRGGNVSGSIERFETSGEFVRAYGRRAVLDSGFACGVDDCTKLTNAAKKR